MTPLQTERIRKKIAAIKRTLAAEKRKFGGYDDSRGLRYIPTKYFIRLADYKGGLIYTKWFDKNFPDDSGFPDFLFEWAIILFKNGKIIEVEKKSLETFFSNTYIFDKFLGKNLINLDKYECAGWETISMAEEFEYSMGQAELKDFADWLALFIASEKFYIIANEFIEIQCRLKTEPVGRARTILVNRCYSLLDKYY
ncbi:MAG: hypothetical protein WAU24_13360 [Chitinophagaceae bacterium]